MTAKFPSRFRGAAQGGLNFDEMVVDNFAGGGGASTGIEAALGRPVDVAINHDPDAVRMHEVNHPHTRHYCESVWNVDPREITSGRPVALVWLSPDCTHFSKARGGIPVKKEIRGLAWIALRYASLPQPSKPRVIMLENVEEFTTWGPLRVDEAGNAFPCPKRKGQTFRSFVRALERQGYVVEWRELRACDYGAPTIRKRLFLIARCDGLPIIWPRATHGPSRQPYRTAAECIDFSLPCPSIFLSKEEGRALGVRRPLADATLRRIAAGVMRYVVNHPDPFVVSGGLVAPFITEHANASNQRNMPADEPLRTICAQVKGGHFAVVAPVLVGCGGRAGQSRPRGANEPAATITSKADTCLVSAFLAKHYTGVVGDDLRNPLPTITATDHNALVTSHLVKLRNNGVGQDMREPLDTITAGGQHFGEVRAFLLKFYSSGGQWQDVREPMHTIPANDRMGLVMVRGEPYRIVDIGMRMLTPAELYQAQGFPADYIIDRDITGRPFTLKAQVARCGNSVSPKMAEALVRANLVEIGQQVAA